MEPDTLPVTREAVLHEAMRRASRPRRDGAPLEPTPRPKVDDDEDGAYNLPFTD